MHAIELPLDYTAVLQQIDLVGEEDCTALAETLYLDRARLAHIIKSLRNKGLVQVTPRPQETWVKLSNRGRRLITALWSQTRLPRPT